MSREPFRAHLYPKDALTGRLDGVKTAPALFLNPRRILHLFLVLLVAGGVSLLFLVSRTGGERRTASPELAFSHRPQLDGSTSIDSDDESITAAALDDGDSETITIAALDDGADDIITIAALDIEATPQAVPVVLHEDGLSMSTVSSASTVGEVLAQQGIVVEAGDYVFPSGGSPITGGTHIYIYHARDLFLTVAGETTTIRSRKSTVGEVLEEADVVLGALDRVEPPLDAPVEDELSIRVVRVREEIETVEEVIPLSVIYQDDPTMDMGQYVVLDWGADGLVHREYRVVYEDGQETERELLSEWEQEPRDQVVAQGTKPVNFVDTPQGPLRYSHSLNMYATWYRPASAGRSAASPWYGLTATGVQVHRGIVAVDPSVIPLGTRLYIPGYGEAVAADTGSAVVGHIIDLGFADHEVPDWQSGWVEVYILE